MKKICIITMMLSNSVYAYEIQDLLYMPLGEEKVIDISYGGSTSTTSLESSGSKVGDLKNFYNSSTLTYAQGLNSDLAISATAEMVFGDDTYVTNDTSDSFYESTSNKGVADYNFSAAYNLGTINENKHHQIHFQYSPSLQDAVSPSEEKDGNAVRGGNLLQLGYKIGTTGTNGQWMAEINYLNYSKSESENAETSSAISTSAAASDLLLAINYQWAAVSEKHFHQVGYSYMSIGERETTNNVNSNKTTTSAHSAGILNYRYGYKINKNSLIRINIDFYSAPEYTIDSSGTDVDVVEDRLTRYTAGYTRTF